ncbi:hypothetical protein JCM19238_4484 [Vibrio ponticus]|nr:hypothetical protein JCM19238_4484 [Vibrio ponticus]
MYLGIDLGTSGIKAVLMTEQGQIIASKTASLTILALKNFGQNKIRKSGGKPPYK